MPRTARRPSTARRGRREDRAVSRALRILENRLKPPAATFHSPDAAGDFLRLLLAGKEREEFWALWLNNHHELIQAELISWGTINGTAVYPREVAKSALRHNAAAVIFGHNHPSGNAAPSQSDKALTSLLAQSLALLDVRVLDHFVVTAKETRRVNKC